MSQSAPAPQLLDALALPRTLKVLLPILVFSAFLTQTKFLPGIPNNIGPFEVTCGLLMLYFLSTVAGRLRFKLPFLLQVLLAIVAVAAISQINLPPSNRLFGLVQFVALLFLFVFLAVVFNLSFVHALSPGYVLKLIAYSLLIVGPWIYLDSASAGGDIQAAGPFRNRAHMGTYMLTAFWLALAYVFWPGIKKRDRRIGQLAMLIALYAITASGRRSAYFALFVGLAGLAVSFLLAQRGKRLRYLLVSATVILAIGLFYAYGPEWLPQGEFFRERVGMIDDRLKAALGWGEESGGEDSFFQMQRMGVMMAFRTSPLLGIGWGGFAKSVYSPTGHEVHSTPLRFLAELGLVGVTLYALFMLCFLYLATRQYLLLRGTAFGATALALALASWSLSISYIYNRHLTERTFWLLLAVLLLQETWILRLAALGRRKLAAARARGPSPAPAAAGAAAAASRRLGPAAGPLGAPPLTHRPPPG